MQKYSLSFQNKMFSSEQDLNIYASHVVENKVKSENASVNNLVEQFYMGLLTKMETVNCVKQELIIQYGQLTQN